MEGAAYFLNALTSNARVARNTEKPQDPLESNRESRKGLSQRQALERVIATQIAPRLIAAHDDLRDRPSRRPVPMALPEFERLLLSQETAALLTYIDRLRREGMRCDTVFLEILAPAARYLGALWESDELDFVSVTIGLGRLREILLVIDQEFEFKPAGALARSAVILPAPGETHSFGAAIVETFLRAAGWRVFDAGCGDHFGVAAGEWIDVIGLSLSSERHLADLREVVAKVRTISKNPSISVLVGGRFFDERPGGFRLVGADGGAADAAGAVSAAQSLLDRGQFV